MNPSGVWIAGLSPGGRSGLTERLRVEAFGSRLGRGAVLGVHIHRALLHLLVRGLASVGDQAQRDYQGGVASEVFLSG